MRLCSPDLGPICAADDAVARLAKETGHPERLGALAVDISNAKSVDAAARTLEREFAGKLGGLINNAAVSAGPPWIALLQRDGTVQNSM